MVFLKGSFSKKFILKKNNSREQTENHACKELKKYPVFIYISTDHMLEIRMKTEIKWLLFGEIKSKLNLIKYTLFNTPPSHYKKKITHAAICEGLDGGV